jgi:hypothetical protein
MKQLAVRFRNFAEIGFRQAIAFAREPFLDVETGISALNHD